MTHWPISLIMQPTPDTCLAACAAMLTGTAVDDFQRWAQCGPPYRDEDLVAYCYLHGVQVGAAFCWRECGGIQGGHLGLESARIHEAPLAGNVWYLGVKSRNGPDAEHAVVFDGRMVLDPLHFEPMPHHEYVILDAYPCSQFPKRPWCYGYERLGAMRRIHSVTELDGTCVLDFGGIVTQAHYQGATFPWGFGLHHDAQIVELVAAGKVWKPVRPDGGVLPAGVPYLVGEAGAETHIPDKSDWN